MTVPSDDNNQAIPADAAIPYPAAAYQPDLMYYPSYFGKDLLEDFTTMGMRQKAITSARVSTPAIFNLILQHRGREPEVFLVGSLPIPPLGWTLQVFDAFFGGTLLFAPPAANSWHTPLLQPGACQTLRLAITPDATCPVGQTLDLVFYAQSTQSCAMDILKMRVTVTR